MKRIIIIGIILTAGCILNTPTQAQISLTTESMGLGGGGTAYVTGYEALFINPANLYMQEKNYSLQISVLQGSYYYDSLLPVSNNATRFNNFIENLDYFGPNKSLEALSVADRDQILESSFNGRRLTREFSTQSDIYWFGLKWVRPKRSYAVSMRTRVAGRYELGRGFFTSSPIEKNGDSIVDQSLNYRHQVLHELSFGFAESFTYLNGLLPNMSEFVVGIAPKIVVSGSYLETNYENRFTFNENNNLWFQHVGYSQQTSGVVSGHAEQQFVNSAPAQVLPDHTFDELLRPSGIGFGLDLGLTYLIPFGDDLSVPRQEHESSEKSLRFSFSVTDIGVIYHNNAPLSLQSGFINSNSSLLSPPSDYLFTGRPNQQLAYLLQLEDFQKISPTITHETEKFRTMLPMSLHAGSMFQYKRIKLTGDVSYSVVKHAFNPSGITGYFGMEVRPAKFLPLRGGVRLAPHLQGFYSVGTGVETRWFDINASVMFRSRNGTPTSEILGASVVGIKMYL